MERRTKPEGHVDGTPRRQSGVIVEREIEVSRSYDGSSFPGEADDDAASTAARHADASVGERTDVGLGRQQRTRRQRVRVVAGTIAAGAIGGALPWIAPALGLPAGAPAAAAIEPTLAALLVGMAALKAGAVLVALAAVLWRLGRTGLARGRRLGYEVALWAMAGGMGLVLAYVPHLGPTAIGGALLFDAGVLLMLVVAAGDGRLRDGRLRDGRLRDGRLRDGRLRDGRLRDGRAPGAAARA